MAMHKLELARLMQAKKEVEPCTKDFKSAAEPLPFMLRTLGLGTTIATLMAKDGNEHTRLANIIARWLLEDCSYIDQYWRKEDENNAVSSTFLLDKINSSNRYQYRQASTEAMYYAATIKRLAQAFCQEDTQERDSQSPEAKVS